RANEHIQRPPQLLSDVILHLGVAAARLVCGPVSWLGAIADSGNMNDGVTALNVTAQHVIHLAVIRRELLLIDTVTANGVHPLFHDCTGGFQISAGRRDENFWASSRYGWWAIHRQFGDYSLRHVASLLVERACLDRGDMGRQRERKLIVTGSRYLVLSPV